MTCQRLPWVRGQKWKQRQRRCGPGKVWAGTGTDGSQPRCGWGGLADGDSGWFVHAMLDFAAKRDPLPAASKRALSAFADGRLGLFITIG